jgi:hypothetical protein
MGYMYASCPPSHLFLVQPNKAQHFIMPFSPVKLNDGRHIPAIGFGTWKIPQDVASDQTQQAIEVGFDHIDTAQVRSPFFSLCLARADTV